MQTLLIAVGAGLAFIVAYHTYGRWLGSKIFNVSADLVCPSHRLRDDKDYVPTPKAIVFGHHFTSIAGTGPIVGPAIAVMWGWLPALLWVVLGSIFIGAVHDFGALVVSLRNNGQTVGDIAGRVLNKRVRLLFLFVLFMALTIVLAIFGLVIAAVFRQYPSAIFPCLVQIPIAVLIGLWLHRQGRGIFWPSLIALAVMYLTVVFGDQNTPVADLPWLPVIISGGINAVESALHGFNAYMASLSTITWVALLLVYSYVASVLPVWTLLQPRDYINSLQLISALALIVVGLVVAAVIGGAPPVEGADRQPLEVVAPMVKWDPAGAPLIFPFLFITIACGAISGFHCLVSSGTSSKQLDNERDARFVGYGSMLTEGFLATLVILACVAGLGLGTWPNATMVWKPKSGVDPNTVSINMFVTTADGKKLRIEPGRETYSLVGVGGIETRPIQEVTYVREAGVWIGRSDSQQSLWGVNVAQVGEQAWAQRYTSWSGSSGLTSTVGAFVDGSANFLKAIWVPSGVAIALMGVLVASFAGTTLDTACRLQRYVVQELAGALGPDASLRLASACLHCEYDLTGNVTGACPECGAPMMEGSAAPPGRAVVKGAVQTQTPPPSRAVLGWWNPLMWLSNKHGATIFAVVVALAIAAMPTPGHARVSLWHALKYGYEYFDLSAALSNTHSGGTSGIFGSNSPPSQAWPGITTSIAGGWEWLTHHGGKGGMILWPMFGATNQLLAGLAFLVIAFYLWRRGKPIWFLVLPLVFMLIMPAWAMIVLLPQWLDADAAAGGINWPLVLIAGATLVLEVWMIVEALLLMPRVRGVIEKELPGSSPTALKQPKRGTESAVGADSP